MSTAYFIVLDSDDPGFDAFVDGKVLTRQLRCVNKIASELGLREFEDYAFQDLSEFGGPELQTEWFDAEDGIRWASAILDVIREDPSRVAQADAVSADLEDYVRVFRQARDRGLRWHLELDF